MNKLMLLIGLFLVVFSSRASLLANPACYMIQNDNEVIDLTGMCGQSEDTNTVGPQQSPGQAYFFLGDEQHYRGALNDAIDSYTLAIEIEPNNDEYYQARASAYMSIGDRASAKADYETMRQNYINSGGTDPEIIENYTKYAELIGG
mgnify:CR=1 FL=1